jgi:hypothetical protein
MDAFLATDLKALAERTGRPSCSLFLPTERAGPDTRQNRLRLKNLLAKAEGSLREIGVRSAEAISLLEPARKLLPDHDFWQRQSTGLAIFLQEGFSRHYRLPLELPELVVAADRFHLKPLFPLLTGDGRFHVLAVSQGQVRLIAATRHSHSELLPEDLPSGIGDALRFDDPEKQLQFHTRTQQRGGERDAMFHGQGSGSDESKDRLLRFFREVDGGVTAVLGKSKSPLVLAAVEYYFPIYREANTYPGLLEDGIPGNPEEVPASELQEQAWRIVEPRFRADQEQALERCAQQIAKRPDGSTLEEVVASAAQGKVSTLFVPIGVHRWGKAEEGGRKLEVHEEAEPGDEDLLDFATVQTFLHDGVVYTIDPDRVPGEAEVAALYRY